MLLASAINDNGQIVGFDGNQSGEHGFIATIAKDCSSVSQSCIAAPTNLSATQVGMNGTQIQLTWEYGRDPIDGLHYSVPLKPRKLFILRYAQYVKTPKAPDAATRRVHGDTCLAEWFQPCPQSAETLRAGP